MEAWERRARTREPPLRERGFDLLKEDVYVKARTITGDMFAFNIEIDRAIDLVAPERDNAGDKDDGNNKHNQDKIVDWKVNVPKSGNKMME